MAKAAMIAGCHAESKALLMSRKAAALTFFSTNPDSIKEMSEWAAVSVDLPSLNPCWKSLIQFNERLYQIRRPRITFSRSFARLEIRLMGL